MSYTPPNGDAVTASWLGASAYTPPSGGATTASFVQAPLGPAEIEEGVTASDAVEITVACSPQLVVETAVATDEMLLMSEDLLDNATASDALLAGVNLTLAESASVSDAVEPALTSNLVESATSADTLVTDAFAVFVEAAVVTETYAPSTLRTRLLADALSARDSLIVAAAATLVETGAASDATEMYAVTLVAESATTSDATTVSAVRTLLLGDIAGAADAPSTGGGALADEGATAADASVTGYAHLLVESAAASDEVADSSTDDDTLVVEAALASDEVTIQITSVQHVRDVVVARDSVSYKQPGAVAWLMNTESGGASWYSNYQFTDIAQVGNLVLAVGPEGLSLHEGALDSGDEIDAGVTWGFTEFGGYDRDGNPQENVFKKRVSDFWLGYTSDGVLEASVETYKNGDPVYTYEMPQRDAEQSTNNCIKPGLGLNARYWRIGINNVGGCDFAVDSLIAHVAQSTRRI